MRSETGKGWFYIEEDLASFDLWIVAWSAFAASVMTAWQR